MPLWSVWIIIGIALTILEIFTPTFLFVLLGVSAILTGILSLLLESFYIQLTIFIILSIITLIYFKPILQNKFKVNKTVKESGYEALIGQSGIVTEEIKEFKFGQVKVNGQYWTAKSENNENLVEGTKIIVKAIDGVKLIVSKE